MVCRIGTDIEPDCYFTSHLEAEIIRTSLLREGTVALRKLCNTLHRNRQFFIGEVHRARCVFDFNTERQSFQYEAGTRCRPTGQFRNVLAHAALSRR